MRSTLTARVAPLILTAIVAGTALPNAALAAMASHHSSGPTVPHRAVYGVSHLRPLRHPSYQRHFHPSYQRHLRPSHPRLRHHTTLRRQLQHPHARLHRPTHTWRQLHHTTLRRHLRPNHVRPRRSTHQRRQLRHATLRRQLHSSYPRLRRPTHVRRQPRRTPLRLRHPVAKKAPMLLYLAAKIEMLGLINAERAQAGAHPLSLDPLLDTVAQWRSQDMITRHYFSHQIPPRGVFVFDTLDRDHVQYEMAGENIALNNYIDFYPMARTVRQTNTDLMNSPDHRANILETKYTKIGLGMAFERGSGKLILTEVFVQP